MQLETTKRCCHYGNTVFSCFLLMKSSILFTRADTAGKLALGKLYQNGIFPNAFDQIPRDHQIILFSKPKKSAASGDDQRQNSCILQVKLKIACIAQPCSVTQIDNFQPPKIRGAATLHTEALPSKRDVHFSICSETDFLGCPFFFSWNLYIQVMKISSSLASILAKE